MLFFGAKVAYMSTMAREIALHLAMSTSHVAHSLAVSFRAFFDIMLTLVNGRVRIFAS